MFFFLTAPPQSFAALFLNRDWSLIGALFRALGKSFGSVEVSSHFI